jgi:predicted transcriptional regulator
MEKTPFEQLILENLYNLWKVHGTNKVRPIQALIEECGFQEKSIRKPLKKLVSTELVEADSYSVWITKKGIVKIESIISSGESTVTREEKAPVSIGINFLKNLEQAINRSDLSAPEREMWLNGIKQLSHNPVLLKAVEAALKSTTEGKQE